MKIFSLKKSDNFHITALVKLGFTGVYIIFLISAQKHRLWVLVGTASSEIKKNNVYPCKPQFYYIKVGFKVVKIYRHVFVIICN